MPANHETYSVFDQNDFFAALSTDMRRARALVILHSPFLSPRRLDMMRPVIEECRIRRVRVCVFIQQLSSSDEKTLELRAISESMLHSLGAHLTVRNDVHEKLVVIDEEIFWEGSLNMLSHRKTSERMTRWISRAKVIEATKRHKLDCCYVCTARQSGLVDGLVRRRKYLGLSQTELARRTGIERSILSKLEAGSRDVKLSTLERLAEELRMNISAAPLYNRPLIEDLFDLSLDKNHWYRRKESGLENAL